MEIFMSFFFCFFFNDFIYIALVQNLKKKLENNTHESFIKNTTQNQYFFSFLHNFLCVVYIFFKTTF